MQPHHGFLGHRVHLRERTHRAEPRVVDDHGKPRLRAQARHQPVDVGVLGKVGRPRLARRAVRVAELAAERPEALAVTCHEEQVVPLRRQSLGEHLAESGGGARHERERA